MKEKEVTDKYGKVICLFKDLIEIEHRDFNNKEDIAIWSNKLGEYRFFKRKSVVPMKQEEVKE